MMTSHAIRSIPPHPPAHFGKALAPPQFREELTSPLPPSPSPSPSPCRAHTPAATHLGKGALNRACCIIGNSNDR